MTAWKNATAAPHRGVVGRAGSAAAFDLNRWAPSAAASEFVEHFWSVSWDLRGRTPFESTVITFPAVHLTHEWGTDHCRHGYPLPATLLHGVVERVFRTTIHDQGTVVGARFRPGGYAARFRCDAAALTGRVQLVDDELFAAPIGLDNDVAQVVATLDGAIAAGAGEPDPTHRALSVLIDRVRVDDQLQRVDQVMLVSPWGARTTQRVFRRYVGVSVKWVLCRYRLQQAALEIETCTGVDFAELAVRLGWYDQAHFINDFRSMLGCTPGGYAARHSA